MESDLRTVRLRLGGMTCAACVSAVERHVSGLSWVRSCEVNLLLESARVQFDAAAGSTQQLVQEIEDIGFEASVHDEPVAAADSSVDVASATAAASADGELLLRIEGMTCAACVSTIERHLRSSFPDWLLSVDINLLTESARLQFNPAHADAGAQQLLDAIEEVGFTATPQLSAAARAALATSGAPEESRAESMLRQKRQVVAHYRKLLIFCCVFAVPVFLMAMLLEYIPAAKEGLMSPVWNSLSLGAVLMGLLSAPLQFGVGSIFYKSAYKSLRHGSANMSVLIAVGTSAAYAYALIDVVNAIRTPLSMGMAAAAATVVAVDPSTGAGMDMGMDSSTGAAYSSAPSSSSSSTFSGGEHFFETASTLITFVILGRYLEAIAKGKTSEALTKLTSMQAQVATMVTLSPEGDITSETEVPASSLRKHDHVKVNRGSKIPADGVVVRGESNVDESFLTGESLPVSKAPGSKVIGSSVNHESTLIVRVDKVSSESTLANILKLMENAQVSKAPIQKVADGISGVFVPTVLAASLLTFLIWFALVKTGAVPAHWVPTSESPFLFSFLFGLSVVVIACPCALGLATPTAVMVGTGVGAAMGILIKGGRALEVAHKVSAIVFDKTGTLTEGKPQVTDVTLFTSRWTYERVVALVGSAELESEHVLGTTLVRFARDLPGVVLPLEQPSEFVASSGRGLVCRVGGLRVAIGNRACMRAEGVEISTAAEEALVSFESAGRIALSVAIDGSFAAAIAMADVAKPESAAIVRHLERMGIAVWMCTGDNARTARSMAEQIGIPRERVVAEALPQDKYELVKRLQAEGKTVAMIGDGLNDSVALVQADLGFSVGAGTDVAMEAADIVLIKNDLRDILVALDLSRATLRRIKLNFCWALGYNCIGLPIAAGVLFPAFGIRLPPELAALAMALSSVSVISSSLLLKRYRRPVIKKDRKHALSSSSSREEELELIAHHTRVTTVQSSDLDFPRMPRFVHADATSLCPDESVTRALIEDDDDDDENEHADFCPCGCDCGVQALRRRAAKRGGAAYEALEDAPVSKRGVKSCCSPPAAPVSVHLSESVIPAAREKTVLKTVLQKAGCACSCADCGCSHHKD